MNDALMLDPDNVEDVSVRKLNTSVKTPDPHDFRSLSCGNCGHQISVPIYCGDRFCPVCSVARNSRVRSRLNFIVKQVENGAGYGFSHLTLTIQNTHDLAAGMRKLVSSFRKLRAKKWWKRHVDGGAFVLETTNKGNGWHVHIHAVIHSKFMSPKELSTLWWKCSGANYCDIRRKPKGVTAFYLCKYLSKNEVPEDLQPEASTALQNFRLYQPFGLWLNIAKRWRKPVYCCPHCKQHSWWPTDILYKDTADWYESCRCRRDTDDGDGDRDSEPERSAPIDFTVELFAPPQTSNLFNA